MNDLKELVRQRNVYLNSRSKELIKLTNLLDKTFPEFKPFFKNRLGVSALFILKRFKTKARISKLSSSDYELIRSKTNGRMSYPKFNGLKQIAKDSIGISSKVYDLLIQTSIHQYEYLTQILKSLDDEIILLFKKTDSKLLTIPGLGIVTAATIYAEVGDFKNFLILQSSSHLLDLMCELFNQGLKSIMASSSNTGLLYLEMLYGLMHCQL